MHSIDRSVPELNAGQQRTVSRTAGRINIVVALGCEARPLVRHFRLGHKQSTAGLRIYTGKNGITLLVSGVGKQATACACGYLAGQQGREDGNPAAWLNIGIAGHGNRRPGEGVLVQKITDQSTGQVSYPSMVFNPGCQTSNLVTVDSPETEYRDACAYDMEGSAFFRAATRFITPELVQAYKIVSDNPDSPVGDVTAQGIAALIEARLAEISLLVESLLAASSNYNEIYTLPDEFRDLEKRTRLTVSQRTQLETAYRRYRALGGTDILSAVEKHSIQNGVDLLSAIDRFTPSQ